MGKRTYFVVKGQTEGDANEHNAYDKYDLPYEKAANALMSMRGYLDYVEEHGYHFTDKLAEKVSSMMVNANGEKHSWTVSQVKTAITGMGHKLADHMTWGDMTYLANMFYADLFPDAMETEAHCLKAAIKIMKDPDGYNGMVFCRWTSDAIGKAMQLEWEDFV